MIRTSRVGVPGSQPVRADLMFFCHPPVGKRCFRNGAYLSGFGFLHGTGFVIFEIVAHCLIQVMAPPSTKEP